MKLARSFGAILLGFLIFFGSIRLLAALAGTLANAPPSGYLLLSVAWTVAAAALAGYAAARMAGAHEFPHAAAVGLLIILMGFISMRQQGAFRPGWYEITLAGCGPVSVMIGAALRLLTKPRQRENSKISGAAMRR